MLRCEGGRLVRGAGAFSPHRRFLLGRTARHFRNFRYSAGDSGEAGEKVE